ncbi:Mob1/phocein family protein [Entamoeba histolytica HM-1:IMSS-B]|uniref:Mob1/phocein family protein n=8 Tax=Entamoeba TaxID=5758 RepID=C4M947_ENTH1|nr:Mob1/phocein family protein [Entamoeba nuttalli P19]XP_654424.1 Mob1/phocein family protein [Entamoeba histolytica HM-1:IMSS]EMD48423.1 Mob1/phocein family protein [Entamoeba histolytica KU27]EMH72606.1 Mob1/phocein family protein [Entamoeba histolytica HM-1:IMSS-B]EMS16587.1 Mob1/phocein family protein [Entamoeba histolytica HM-3:IMSS]ENY61487.1 Mob1/phocein family protein, putative [Entamoeba histolytica HM-1:IMSS-A]GAT98168.1 mob1 phocein family protein [Entamoeba histolytica]|eukprot:XP_008859504.1 Mob1/phocein family protein [Entamoeba nuttalli P19]
MFGRKKIVTMKPIKKLPHGTVRHELHIKIKDGVNKGDILHAVKCPPGQNINDWVAVNCFDLFNEINLTYSSITALCTTTRCPVMNAGPKMEYVWIENNKSVKLSAPEYCEKLFTWVQNCFDDTSIFPAEFTSKPPKQFAETVRKIFKRLFRVYAHMFYNHMEHLEQLGIQGIALRGFKHFYAFCRQYKMLGKEDVVPLHSLVEDLDKEFGFKSL